VEDSAAIANALKKIIAEEALWEEYSGNGIKCVNEKYSWEAHTNKYMSVIEDLLVRKETSSKTSTHKTPFGKKFTKAELFIISDLDGTLIDGKNEEGLKELKQWMTEHKDKIVFGVASGRNKEITQEALMTNGINNADIMICSAGSEIYYTNKFIPDNGFESHIDYQWKREELQKALEKLRGIRLQEPEAQWPYKLSYYVNNDFDEDDIANLYKFLDDRKLRAKLLITENHYLDVLPFRAGKGNAVHYLSYKWKIPPENFITAGNSGNDIDMLKGKAKGIVVANHSPEMEQLKKSKNIYFASKALAAGVLEGINHYMSTGLFV
jgi:sucrose-phosphate synthase